MDLKRKHTPRELSAIERARKAALTDSPEPQRVKFSDRLRRQPTKNEALLWHRLKTAKFKWGVEIWRQTVIEGYILDFYFPDLYLGVELDGPFHDAQRDSRRDAKLLHRGVRIIRFPNPESKQALTDTVFRIYAEVRYQQARKVEGNPQKFGASSLLPPSESESVDPSWCKDECSGKVENARIQLIKEGLLKGKLSAKFRISVDNEKGCERQVYTSREVAENAVRSLERIGIRGSIEQCKACGRLHVIED